MKYTFLFLSILLFISSFTFNSATNPSITAAVSADKMNVFYIGVLNPISVAISSVPIEDTKVSISNGIIGESHIKGQYYVRVFEVGKVWIYLEGKDRNGNIVSTSSEFRVKRIPDPTPRLEIRGWHGYGNIYYQKGILAVLENFDFDVRFEVLTFEIEHHRGREPIQTYFNEGAKFSEENLKIIQDTRIGDVYYFKHITVRDPDNEVRYLPTMSFKVR